MNFLMDANLPRRITQIFQERGHSAIPILDLTENRYVELTREYVIVHA